MLQPPDSECPEPGKIALAPGEVHLWLSYYDGSAAEAQLMACRQVLTPAEQEREHRFHFPQDRHQYVFTRALVRTVLSRYASPRPIEWTFTQSLYGKPEVSNEVAREMGLSFNVSHTHSLIVLGVCRRGMLGVDVENIVRRRADMAIVTRFFEKEEIAALSALEGTRQHSLFFEYWTLKEAYIKARGQGLSLPLDEFGIRYQGDEGVALWLRDSLMEAPEIWQLWLLQPREDYFVAVCTERLASSTPTLVVRELTPGTEPSVVAPRVLRMSGREPG